MKSWNEIRKSVTAFSKRWKNTYDEKSQAQSFLNVFSSFFSLLSCCLSVCRCDFSPLTVS